MRNTLSQWMNREVLGNDLSAYLTALGILVGGIIAIALLQRFIFKRIEQWATRTHNSSDDFLFASVRGTFVPLAYYGVFVTALDSLRLNLGVERAVKFIGMALLTVLVVRFLLAAIRFGVFEIWLTRRENAVALRRQLTAFVPIWTGLIWLLGIVFLLENLGFKVTSIVAGLGIGGAAIALASQSILGDLFSYFSIMLDRPFELDDFIIIGSDMGTIEHIGIKTTRIRSLDGEQLILSNKDLTDSRIRNYKRMQLRRVAFKLHVTYNTSEEKLKQACVLIRQIIEGIKKTRFDRAHFFAYRDADLEIEVVYFVLSEDYNVYMDVQQNINLGIKKAFEREGIEFALPARIIYLHREPRVKEPEAAAWK
jgi:small-conductance mechanosensitive channel